MTTPQPRLNPFPGLRPFEPEEDHLFFGREREIDELVRRLRTTRFLSVVGTSGSGKSSLVRCGLITALHGGLMVGARPNWRVAVIRPGEDPIGNLAVALAHPGILKPDPRLDATESVVLNATLRRSTSGLADAVRFAHLPAQENVLIVVDQFEELFRFRANPRIENSRDESIAFVKLLLEAAGESDLPIYVVLTMRADFIGDCMAYPGLPEAVNSGQYLVPRMDRDALRSAVTGPVAVAGGTIAPRYVLRLLNDIGDDPNQLPVFQHALMRTWDAWARRGRSGEPIDLADYESVGTLRRALSQHAEEAFRETGSEPARQLAERMFKALTDMFCRREVRRPTMVSELAAICEASEADVIAVADVFRQPGRSFLMPPVTVPLTSQSIVDLSHESLIKCWDRLATWAEEERTATAFYARLSQAAAWEAEGTGSLWDAPELDLALQWKQRARPTEAWARRFEGSFHGAMAFLDRSAAERTRVREEQERNRRRKLRQAWTTAAVTSVLFVVTGFLAYFAWQENRRAEAENRRAETNLRLATAAVDETLSAAQVDPERAGADVPQLSELRRKLLEKAKNYSLEFLKQNPDTEKLRAEMAFAHFRLGHISRSLGMADDAAEEYQRAIGLFDALDREQPSAEYKRALANAYNWLGETYRAQPDRKEAAAQAYERAFALQSALAAADPGNAAYRQELARTHYNRGIVRASSGASDARARAEEDFREAIRLLESLPTTSAGDLAVQELARVYNNLGVLIELDTSRLPEAAAWYDRAVGLHEKLLASEPDNQQYRLELAQWINNSAEALRQLREFARARERNQRALALLGESPRPPPLLAIELADSHQLRAGILQAENNRSGAILSAYEESLHRFHAVGHDPAAVRLEQFHLRFGDLLVNIADRCGNAPDAERAHRLLMDAVDWYVSLAGSRTAPSRNADTILKNLSELLPEFGEAEQRLILQRHPRLLNSVTSLK